MLEIRNLEAWYGESHALHGVSLDVRQGEVVTLLGRNGAGKTSTLRAIMGLVGRRTGAIRFEGRELIDTRPDLIARARHRLLPGGARHLRLARRDGEPDARRGARPGGLPSRNPHAVPELKERARSQGTKLSGGEQQMLAIARILRTGAQLLLLDEPSEGWRPVIVQQIGDDHPRDQARGFTVLLVEQNFRLRARRWRTGTT
jgi:branched-chain amino acid transport system ATP-binding protein